LHCKFDFIMPTTANLETRAVETIRAPRRFDFERDSFAFANELHWEYHFDATTGKTTFSQRDPKPAYAHRCFVLTRAARQFLYHAQFDAKLVPYDHDDTYRRRIQEVMARNPRTPGQPGGEILFPGFASLREFSRAHEALLKAECGGAWRSYVLRSHWRMVFPISRAHQECTAASLLAEIQRGASPIIHLVLFPKLAINHGMILFDASETPTGVVFEAYDPNQPAKPTEVSFDRATRTFSLPANHYWAGGALDVLEIYRGWWM
jgi:hypothetical protein